jgi:hypothetical protein
MTRSAPREANLWAIAEPIPLELPVTRATFPVNGELFIGALWTVNMLYNGLLIAGHPEAVKDL